VVVYVSVYVWVGGGVGGARYDVGCYLAIIRVECVCEDVCISVCECAHYDVGF